MLVFYGTLPLTNMAHVGGSLEDKFPLGHGVGCGTWWSPAHALGLCSFEGLVLFSGTPKWFHVYSSFYEAFMLVPILRHTKGTPFPLILNGPPSQILSGPPGKTGFGIRKEGLGVSFKIRLSFFPKKKTN